MNNIQEIIDKLKLFNKLNPEIIIDCCSCKNFNECLVNSIFSNKDIITIYYNIGIDDRIKEIKHGKNNEFKTKLIEKYGIDNIKQDIICTDYEYDENIDYSKYEDRG